MPGLVMRVNGRRGRPVGCPGRCTQFSRLRAAPQWPPAVFHRSQPTAQSGEAAKIRKPGADFQ